MPKKKSKFMLRRRSVALLIVLLVLIPLLAELVNYGLSNKPIVDYTFGGSGVVRVSYRLSAMTLDHPGTIDLFNVLVRNRGRTDISVIITVHAINALVSTSHDGPYNDMASILIVAFASNEYRFVSFYITLKKQVSSFSISCDASIVADYSTLSSSIISAFGEIQPTFPTFVQYSQESTNPYNYLLAQ